MTLADLDKMEAALAQRLLPWIAKASKRIIASVKDAEAHAVKALTDSVRDEQDGQRTARRFQRGPSYQAAINRLGSLQAALIGPSSDSTEGLIRDARAAFYADSVRLWTPHVEPEYRITLEPAPTAAGERLMRTAIVHGYDLSREVGPSIETAKRNLFVAMNRASRRGSSADDGVKLIGLWAQQTRDQLIRKVSQVLSDSDKAVHEATGWLLIKPEYRGERTLTTGGIHF
ncbi:MAG: hypothetical protein KGR26_08380 [Cyanobacteria bacterium REEB65]|nr:hypothetical protein [Cyanobacteria bacterium REEB65]